MCRLGRLLWKVLVCGDRAERCGSESATASKSVVVAVLGLAEFVEEEDHGLQAQDQHYPTNEACSIKRVLVGLRRRNNRCGTRIGYSCDKRQNKRKTEIVSELSEVVRGPFLKSQCQTWPLTCRGWNGRGGDVTAVSGHNGACILWHWVTIGTHLLAFTPL